MDSGPVQMELPFEKDKPEGYIGEETLRAMSEQDLNALIDDNQIPVPAEVRDDREAVIHWLLKEFGVD